MYILPFSSPSIILEAAGGKVANLARLTHGSVVACEYGVPAVVGVHQATIRLKNGQRIRVDGIAGKIVIIEQNEN